MLDEFQRENEVMHESPPARINWEAIGVIVAVLLSGASFVYGQVEQTDTQSYAQAQAASAGKAVQENHTAQIAQLQISLNGEQTLLYSINDSLAKLTQKIEDGQAYRASQRQHP